MSFILIQKDKAIPSDSGGEGSVGTTNPLNVGTWEDLGLVASCVVDSVCVELGCC